MDLFYNLANYVHIHIHVFDVMLSLIYKIMSCNKTYKNPNLINSCGLVLPGFIINNVHMHRIIGMDIDR